MKNISCFNGCRQMTALQNVQPIRSLAISFLSVQSVVINLILPYFFSWATVMSFVTSWGCVRLLALRLNRFPGIKKGLRAIYFGCDLSLVFVT